MIQSVILFCIVAAVTPLPVQEWNIMKGNTFAVSRPENNSNYILNYSTNDQNHYQIGTPGKAVEGTYSFTDKLGRIHRVDYKADNKGYRAKTSITEPKLAVASKRIRCVPIMKSKSQDSNKEPEVPKEKNLVKNIAVLEKNDTTSDNNISAHSIIQIQEDLNGEEVIGEVRKRQAVVKSTYQQQSAIVKLAVSYPCPAYPFLCLVPFSVPIMLG